MSPRSGTLPSAPSLPGSRLARALAFLVPILLVVPFDPQWPDFERARRGLLLVLVGVALLAGGLRRDLPARPLLWLPGLAAIAVASSLWAGDPLSALEQGAYLTALAALPFVLPRVARATGTGVAAALLVTSVYGLLQCLGLEWPQHYTVAHEPVSTLGNRNVAAEWTALATPLALLAPPALGWPATALGGCYLWANGGRAGLLAWHLGLLVLLLRHRTPWRRRALVLPLLVAVALGGHALRPVPPPVEAVEDSQLLRAGLPGALDNTARVRLLIWPRALEMTRDHLPLGVGAGNFAARFPQYRDPREIEISTLGHRIGSRVDTPHNDLLLLLAELGLLGGAFLALFAWSLIPRLARTAPVALASCVAFLPVAMFRAPLLNAPAAAVTIAALALALPAARRALPRAIGRAARGLGLPLLAAGCSILVGETCGAGFLRARRLGDTLAGATAVERAVRFDPLAPDWRLLRAQIHHRRGDPVPAARLPEVLTDLASVLDRRPGDYRALLDVGYLGLAHPELRQRGARAVELLVGSDDGPGLDPRHPVARLLAANYACLDKDWERAFGHLIELRSQEALAAGLRLLRGFKERAPELPEKIEIARRIVALEKLARALFPDAPEFGR